MYITIWGVQIPVSYLSESHVDYLKSLPEEQPAVEWIWEEMDRVWDSYSLNNTKPLAQQDLGAFYGHPIWIANGVFTSIDHESVLHRCLISKKIAELDVVKIADYGGGSGVLARQIIKECVDANVDIIEPFSFPCFKQQVAKYDSIEFCDTFRSDKYDVIVAQDVLEHVENPIDLAAELATHTRIDGYLIFANCFKPVIKCHIPSTFHLRHTFSLVMRIMGLSYLGNIEGASHMQVFKKCKALNLERAKKAEKLSQFGGSKMNSLEQFVRNNLRYSS